MTAALLWREYLLLGLLALLWGSSYLFLKVAVAEIPPATLIAARVTIAAVFLMIVLRFTGGSLPRDRTSLGRLLVQAFFNSIGAWTLLAWGQQHIGSGVASVLNSTSPLFVFLGLVLFARQEAGGLIRLVGALLGLAGVCLIVGTEAVADIGLDVAGQLAALGSAILYACAALYGRRLSGLGAPATAAGTMIWATAVLVPASLVIDRPWTLSPSTEAIGAAAILGIACTGVALLIYFRLLRTLGSLGTASQSYLRAGVGALLGVIFLGETLEPAVAAGILLTVLGVAAINRPAR